MRWTNHQDDGWKHCLTQRHNLQAPTEIQFDPYELCIIQRMSPYIPYNAEERWRAKRSWAN